MCGIAGLIDPFHTFNKDDLQTVITRMTNTLHHRGPDDSGLWTDLPAGIALGHRRLAIVDLSPEGHQPMLSANKRFVIVFNGEIYNFKALRKELLSLGHHFRGHSDTEIMLAAISQWGMESALKRFVGMFAFALWDRQERNLYIARDRIGEKPLYYGWMGNLFLFGSELKALKACPNWQAPIDRNALALFIRHNCIPAPYSIYQGIQKLLPGTWLCLPLNQITPGHCPQAITYWSAREVAEAGVTNPFPGSETDAVDQLDLLLRETIAHQMVADVPLGAFLSGGIDSSTIVALMQAQSERPIKTFTIGLHEKSYNEATYAKAVAHHLGTDHTEFYVSPKEATEVIPLLPTLYDEPFADSSQIPTFLVAKLTRQHVTVSLSGDGGDELFGGYHRYVYAQKLWQEIAWLPLPTRYAISRLLTSIPNQILGASSSLLTPVLSRYGRVTSISDKIHRGAEFLAANSPMQLYQTFVSHWKDPAALVLAAHEPATIIVDREQWSPLLNLIQQMMYFDLVTYLPDDILVKVDRASMGMGLESRIPFLDHRVVAFAWSLPFPMKVRQKQSKWLLRQLLYRYVPSNLIERPKAGFGIPLDNWLRGPLREWAENLLDEQRLRCEGFFDPHPIQEKWQQYLKGEVNWSYHLWDILMFQAWLDNNKHGS